ncbi:MAG: hypothetical protein ACYC2G_01350 [Gemmatimonadaceae bacterium]
MTAETRRRLATLLVGAMAMLTALLVASMVRQERCLDAGGRWLAATRDCELPVDSVVPPSSVWPWALGLAAGLLTAAVMWRAYTYFATSAARRARQAADVGPPTGRR